MEDISLKYAGELVRGVVELLWPMPDGLPGTEVIAQLPEKIKLTDDDLSISSLLHWPKYAEAVRLVTIPLVKAGWLLKTEKGQWLLTEEGRAACQRFSTPHDLYLDAQLLNTDGRKDIPKYQIFLEFIREEGWMNISHFIRGMNSVEIRRIVALLLDAMQYHVTWVAPPEKNRGLIDMIASVDPIGANELRILIQIKHTGQPVTLEGLKSFTSILGPDDFGLLFSSGGFTSEVKEVQNKEHFQKINVMDLVKFYDLWVKHYDNLSQEAHILFPLQAIFFLSPFS